MGEYATGNGPKKSPPAREVRDYPTPTPSQNRLQLSQSPPPHLILIHNPIRLPQNLLHILVGRLAAEDAHADPAEGAGRALVPPGAFLISSKISWGIVP